MVNWLMNGLVSWLAETVNDLLGGLLAFLTSSIFVSPDITVLPQVRAIAGNAALVVNACFVVAVIAAGIAVMLGDSLETQYHVKHLVPRLVVGFVLSVFAVPLTGLLIDVANALTVAMAGEAAPTTEAIAFVRARVASAMTDPSNALLIAVIGLLIVVLMFMLVGTWLARIGILVILAGIAPVALAGYATPWTQGFADLWWRALLGCLATPALQAVAFSVGHRPAGRSGVESADPARPARLGHAQPAAGDRGPVDHGQDPAPDAPVRHLSRAEAPNITGLILRTVAFQGMTRGLGRRP